MAGPRPLQRVQIPRRVLRGQRLPDTVDAMEKYVTGRAQFDQSTLANQQQVMTDMNGQQNGGIVLAADLQARTQNYQNAASNFPHYGDQPSQPSATSYDGPLTFGALPAGVNSTFGYARWTGWLFVPASGTYGFRIVSTNGSNLWVNKVELVAQLQNAGSIDVGAAAALVAGQVPIVVEWQWASAPNLQVYWTPPASSEELIPNTVLSRALGMTPSGFLVGHWWDGTEANWYP